MNVDKPEEWIQAERAAQELPIQDVVARLRSTVGVRLVAYMGGVNHTSYVAAWADGREVPSPDKQWRLRTALHAMGILLQRWDPITIQAWFLGMNPVLGDDSPARTIRDGVPGVDGEVVVAAKAAMIE
jgi:hypothetical protein